MPVQRAFSGSTWEKKVGYCRAVKAGNLVFISGTASVAEGGGVHAPGDPYGQAVRCFEIMKKALDELSVPWESIVRTRVFMTDMSHWEHYARAHREHFGVNPPASAFIEVKGFMTPDMLVEIEADAVIVD